MTAFEYRSSSPDQTHVLGIAIGRRLRGGDFLALTGALGAGKTQLVKGLAVGVGVHADEPVVSPTFVLVREYVGRLTLYHIDAYRLGGPTELLDLGLDEMGAESDAVVAVEWADRVAEALPADACWIELEHAGESERRLRIRWSDTARLADLAAEMETL